MTRGSGDADQLPQGTHSEDVGEHPHLRRNPHSVKHAIREGEEMEHPDLPQHQEAHHGEAETEPVVGLHLLVV